MDWLNPYLILLIVPAALLLWWFHRTTLRPLESRRKWLLLATRTMLVLLGLLILAGPAREEYSNQQAVIFIFDHSQSQGEQGLQQAWELAGQLVADLPAGTAIGYLSAGDQIEVLQMPQSGVELPKIDLAMIEREGGQSDLASAVKLANGLFPPGTHRRIVYLGDGEQTRGDLEAAVREAALHGVVFDAVPVAGPRKPDVRVVDFTSDRSRSHEGATIELSARLESSLAGSGLVRLFENGVEVETQPLTTEVGQQQTVRFRRAPDERNLYSYRVRVEGFEEDTLVENNEALTLVDVRGEPSVLYVEGETDESTHLVEAMSREGIRVQVRSPRHFPRSLQELAGYDGVVISDVPAHHLTEESMELVRQYVEQLGGGFVMIGGKNSFGVGGYYRTPIEEILPVKIKAPNTEQKFATALCLVIDRSGSMSGQKIEICKSAAVATVDLMSAKDYVCVVAFDSAANKIVPMQRVSSKGAVKGLISTLSAGGGTNMLPGMQEGYDALKNVRAKVKHMIVLTDGHTSGSGYEQLAAQMKAEGMTISGVAVGQSANSPLLQQVALIGGGKFYLSVDPSNLPQIFTQDAMTHMGRMIREQPFAAVMVEDHPMLKGCPILDAPSLLGYVKTNRKETAQVPLVTDLGDPLLAHWQFGLGKVTAFTSDCKSRWAALWLSEWSNYNQFWSQLLRETVRKPQGHFMDIRVTREVGRSRIVVDLLEDAVHFSNDAAVEADVYFVATGTIGSNMRQIDQLPLLQTGPGSYEGFFTPEESGVYLVRARGGAQMVTAGHVHQTVGEAATGRINRELLAQSATVSGGRIIEDGQLRLESDRATRARFVELAPLLLKIFLLLFVVDLVIRRWDNIQGFYR